MAINIFLTELLKKSTRGGQICPPPNQNRVKMQMVLEDKDLWSIVSGEEVEPVGE